MALGSLLTLPVSPLTLAQAPKVAGHAHVILHQRLLSLCLDVVGSKCEFTVCHSPWFGDATKVEGFSVNVARGLYHPLLLLLKSSLWAFNTQTVLDEVFEAWRSKQVLGNMI